MTLYRSTNENFSYIELTADSRDQLEIYQKKKKISTNNDDNMKNIWASNKEIEKEDKNCVSTNELLIQRKHINSKMLLKLQKYWSNLWFLECCIHRCMSLTSFHFWAFQFYFCRMLKFSNNTQWRIWIYLLNIYTNEA